MKKIYMFTLVAIAIGINSYAQLGPIKAGENIAVVSTQHGKYEDILMERPMLLREFRMQKQTVYASRGS